MPAGDIFVFTDTVTNEVVLLRFNRVFFNGKLCIYLRFGIKDIERGYLSKRLVDVCGRIHPIHASVINRCIRFGKVRTKINNRFSDIRLQSKTVVGFSDAKYTDLGCKDGIGRGSVIDVLSFTEERIGFST